MTNIPCEEMDTLVIGFGPAGIALACAVADWQEMHGISPVGRAAFLERSTATSWHGEFLLRNTDINHHIFRDLVTPRDPRSRFSFANYLKTRGRLYHFGLLGRPPSRMEWSDYLSWAASQLTDFVRYGEPVRAVSPIVENDILVKLQVTTDRGSFVTSKLVMSSGSTPKIPLVFDALRGPNVFHTSSYLSHVTALAHNFPKRWLVVGSGQSAGEAVSDLLQRRPDVLINSVHRSSGFRIGQLGQFPNLTFLPEQVDYFHSLDTESRGRLFEDVRATNYAGIDADESSALYSQIYEDRVEGRERLHMRPFCEIDAVTNVNGSYHVLLRDTFSGARSRLTADAIVLGTGFEQPPIPSLLAELLPWLELAADGGIAIDRDYRVALKRSQDVAIFANGLSERAHGISDAQSFSLVAMRAERILTALRSTACASIERTAPETQETAA
jgi:L-ornithine N5-oxygenase